MVYYWWKSNEPYICSIRNNTWTAICHEPINRRRFIVMSLMPILLGIIPLTIFLLSPPNAFLSGICIPIGDYWYAFSDAGLYGCPYYLQTSTQRCFRSYSKWWVLLVQIVFVHWMHKFCISYTKIPVHRNILGSVKKCCYCYSLYWRERRIS